MCTITYKASSKNKVFGLGRATICGLNVPFPLVRIELGSNHDGVESAVLFDTHYLVDVIEVLTQILIVGVVIGPVPCLVYLGPRELVLRDFGVDAGAGVAVPSPSATSIVAGLENNRLQSAITESLEHENTGYFVSWWTNRYMMATYRNRHPRLKHRPRGFRHMVQSYRRGLWSSP